MTFHFPDDLAPEAYPLAWLLGHWRGPGFVAYPGIPQQGVLTDAEFTHDGGPYLTYRATTWLLDTPLESLEQKVDLDALQTGQVWSAESGYWRIPPSGQPEGEATSSAAGRADGPPATALEVLLAEPSGHVSVYLGQVQGPRVELNTDLVARTATGAEIGAASRMYGLVGGELMWATDLAAFGHELQSYSSGRLQRID